MTFEIDTNDISAHVVKSGSLITIRGHIKGHVVNQKLVYAAAAPADKRSSFTGSGLPWPNADQAFDHSPNIGYVHTDAATGAFTINLQNPNAYYIALGSMYVGPKVYLSWITKDGSKKERSIDLGQGIAYRKLTYPWQRSKAMFYDNKRLLTVRSQEQILRDSAYDSTKEADRFWGSRPPM